MPRAPFQVLVLPFRAKGDAVPEYCVLYRSDLRYWQFVAGGGEGEETPEQAARREAFEECGVPITNSMYRLQSHDTVPVIDFQDRHHWPPQLYVIPQYAFATHVESKDIVLSSEHAEARWLKYDAAQELLQWQSNQTALWELNERLRRDDLPAPHDSC